MNLSNKVVVQGSKGEFNYLQFRRLNKLGIKNVYTLKPHFFNTRPGVVSQERLTTSLENYKKLCNEFGFDINHFVKHNQTHTGNVKCVEAPVEKMCIEEGEFIDTDGTITDLKGVTLASVNADCILFLMYDPVKKVIANVHSGWRGTVQKIAVNAVKKMVEQYSCNPEDIIVCISPSIRKCHFEVKIDAKELFDEAFSNTNKLDKFIEYIGKDENGDDKWRIDTIWINKYMLMKCGIKEENIEDSGICSVCNSEIVNSCRADGKKFGLATALISM